MTAEEKIKRAHEAQRILESNLYKDAWMGIRQQLLDDWAMAETTEARERIHFEFKALDRVQQYLSSAISDGTLTRMTIDRMRKRAEI
jgi:hypothetical protein